MKQYQRVCIYPKDVSIVLGKSIQQSRRILSLIKDAYGKEAGQYLSIAEFAAYTGLPIADIQKACR